MTASRREKSASPCDHDGAQKPHPRIACLDQRHLQVLSIMRCYFFSYANTSSVSWENGLEAAVRFFGEDRGLAIAWACLNVIQAMRSSRSTTFQFCNPFCECCQKRLTRHEEYLLDGLQAIAQGGTGQARIASMLLCEGNPDDVFLACLERLESKLHAFA